MKVDEFVRLFCFIFNCVVWFEGEVIMLFLMCSLVSKKYIVDFFVERIKCFEVEFVEIKKVRFVYMLIVFVRVFFFFNEVLIFVYEVINMWLVIF